MKKLLLVSLMCAFASLPAVAQDVATKGKMLVSADGSRIGAVYRVSDDGSAQVIVNGKLVSIPASTLSVTDGKLTTSMSRHEVMSMK